MSYKLFLDDCREPVSFLNAELGEWYTVRNYNQFVETIMGKGMPDWISFDHDLADEHYHQPAEDGQPLDYTKYKEKTGYDCAVWLIEYCMKTNQPLPQWQVHSFNPMGRKNIDMILSTYRNKEEICE